MGRSRRFTPALIRPIIAPNSWTNSINSRRVAGAPSPDNSIALAKKKNSQLRYTNNSLQTAAPERLAMSNDFPRFDLTGQVALVTGAARGLGRAIALALAHAGADVALGLRDVRTGGELAREIAALGRRVLPLQMDVTKRHEIFLAVDDAVAHFGKLDVLVNNVGVAP